ncbi:MAG TPA: asparaginase [Planctomycetota bacterium]|nr:asparaginase [Planctomycetota bacterium]
MPRPDTDSEVVLATVSRSGRRESWHRGAVAVWHDGDLLFGAGMVDRPVFCRSAVKPFQALPLFERGVVERLGLTTGEIAVLCASHDGTPLHVAVVRTFLARGSFGERQLGCGPHAPFDPAARSALLLAGQKPQKVHNNCSGKHTGFLHLARDCGDDLDGYLASDNHSQGEVHAAIAAMAGVTAPIPLGTDGCGAPTFELPLSALARAFARLANPIGLPAVRSAACRAILHAAGAEPELLAGPTRFCTALLRTQPGRMFAKNGAEGVYAVGLAPDPARRRCPGGVGIAIKVQDGSERAYQPVVVDLLLALGCWPQVPQSLCDWHVQPLRNTRGEPTGEVRCAVDWSGLR